jgi:hypothetical protein
MNGHRLHLVLIKKWFDKHQDDKDEEYREITPYWCNRLLTWNSDVKNKKFWADIIDTAGVEGIQYYIRKGYAVKRFYSEIVFSHGMKPMDILPRFERKLLTLSTGPGNKEWGGGGKDMFILKCGKVTNKVNC